MKKKVLLGLLIGVSISLHAQVKGAVGIAGEHVYSIYDNVDTHTKFIPMVFINYGNYYAKGTKFGGYLYRDSVYTIGGGLSLDFSSTERNENLVLEKMDEIKGRVNLNLLLERKSEFANLLINVDRDISSTTDGFRVTTEINKPMRFNALTITPRLGTTWSDENTNKYLYGVSATQATSQYSSYSPEDSFEPYIELGLGYKVMNFLGITAAVRYTKVSDTVADSPITDGDNELKFRLGLLYHFKL